MSSIRILLGLLKADAGDVVLLGGDLWRDAVELHRRLAYVPGDVTLWPGLTGGEIIDLLLIAERNAALRTAFAELPPHGQHLLAMLFRDPPCSYAEISATLGIPIGSIGPQRARCLERLRQSPALTALGESEFSISSPGGGHGAG